MAPLSGTSQRPTPSRARSTRPRSIGAARSAKSISANISSEPPHKKRKYVPGGPGGGGRYVADDGTEMPVGGTGPGGYNYVGSRGRVGRQNAAVGLVPEVYTPRDRSTRTRTVLPRSQQPPMRFTSAAQAAAVVQSDGYKPREERAWEEFHPNLEIGIPLRAFNAYEVEGEPEPKPVTKLVVPQSSDVHTPNAAEASKTAVEAGMIPITLANGELMTISIPGTPGGGKRRPGRPPKDPIAFFAAKAAKLALGLGINTPKASNLTHPVSNISAKEKLTLPQPSYRKTETLARFDNKALGLVKYVDKSMANVGYQETDIFLRPERALIKGSDTNLEEDLDMGPGHKSDGEGNAPVGGVGFGRVEYDMDEQDDKWLDAYNFERKAAGVDKIEREIFEITITKIEKEWHNLERRIPKPNPKPPQTHRPRSSSAAAVNGEPQIGEEQDSKCAICDDGDCENTNAIVFCDGCDLAVHQECYGVPFIPEGQWLCRKCQLIGRGVPTCIFCPNTDGAFKQTNASKWAHLLCAMWIPEVSLGNHTFMEPVMEVEKVPKTRWKLTCYLCNQRMGACIQCGNKACYQAFHVTCARKARLFLKMKNSHGTLSVLDGTTNMKAFCDKHCPADWIKDNDVARATLETLAFYKRTMRGRLWADSQGSALAMAATHRSAITENITDGCQSTGAKVALGLADSKKKSTQPQKAVCKLPSGAPVIPLYVFEKVEKSLQRFNFQKRREFTADACRYWTLKREARRGAALLKRLQLQMETFSSTEITRKNFAGMGPAGRFKLHRRIDFARSLLKELEKLKELAELTVERESVKFDLAGIQEEFVGLAYFPVSILLPPIVHKALVLDSKHIFTEELLKLREKIEACFYVGPNQFVHDLSVLLRDGIAKKPVPKPGDSNVNERLQVPLTKKSVLDIKERKKLGRRIIKAVQPQLEYAVRSHAETCGRSFGEELKEMEQLLASATEPQIVSPEFDQDKQIPQVNMADEFQKDQRNTSAADQQLEIHGVPAKELVVASGRTEENAETDINSTSPAEAGKTAALNRSNVNDTNTPSDTDGYVSAPEKLQQTPPTPPVSNVDGANPPENVDSGGLPWYLQEFQIEGLTTLPGERAVSTISDELSDMDDDELRGLGIHMNGGDGETALLVAPVLAPASASPATANANATAKGKKSKGTTKTKRSKSKRR